MTSVLPPLARDRREIKYLVSTGPARELERTLDERLGRHRYGGHGANTLPLARHYTTTIYFDTPDRALYQTTTSSQHLKLRAREYYDLHPELVEVATDPAQIVRHRPVLWLELKLREGEHSGKQRVGVPKREVLSFLQSCEPSAEIRAIQRRTYGDEADAVLATLRGFLARFDGGLAPSCLVHYRRTAWEDPEGTLRVTLDRELAAFAPPTDLFAEERPLVRETLGTVRHAEPRAIVEVKVRATVPDWLERALAEVGERAESYSKFRVASAAVHGPG